MKDMLSASEFCFELFRSCAGVDQKLFHLAMLPYLVSESVVVVFWSSCRYISFGITSLDRHSDNNLIRVVMRSFKFGRGIIKVGFEIDLCICKCSLRFVESVEFLCVHFDE